MVLPQFAHYRSPGFEFSVNATENHRNLVLNGFSRTGVSGGCSEEPVF